MGKESKQNHKWESIVKIVWRDRSHFSDLLTDDTQRVRIQFFAVFLIFAVVSTVMTIVNLVTKWHLLMLSTLYFAIANVINVVLMLICKQTEYLARFLFAVEFTSLFLFFLVSGEPEGFSAIWIVLLPACGLLLYRLKYGVVLSCVNFLFLILLFWMPSGRTLLMYEYSESFMLRFPLLYMASFATGTFFELIRNTTQNELVAMRYNYEQLSKRDPLTGLYNRLGFYSRIGTERMLAGEDGCAYAIVDLDYFKTVNDTRGHLAGDVVLKDTAELIVNMVGENGAVCRWGGDEMSIFFFDQSSAERLCNDILLAVRRHEYCYNQEIFHITVSIGLTLVKRDDECGLNELIGAADKNLYLSKENGKDHVVVSQYEPPFQQAASKEKEAEIC